MENKQDYEKLLDEAYAKIKPIQGRKERFEIPPVEGHFEGTKTILTNFSSLCDYVRRNCAHVEKFLQRGLATPSKREGDRLVLLRKVPSAKINSKIKEYVQEFVICKECGKPDTELVKQDTFLFLHCLACGAKHSVRAKIQ